MITVGEILRSKGGAVWTVTPQTTVYETLELMATHDIGAVFVMDGQQLVGIFSERDYARKVVLKGRTSRETPVSDLMTGKVFFVKPESTDEDCMRLMMTKRIRHLPVMNGDSVIGVISVGDVVKAQLRDREFRIQQLENYISGPTYPEAT